MEGSEKFLFARNESNDVFIWGFCDIASADAPVKTIVSLFEWTAGSDGETEKIYQDLVPLDDDTVGYVDSNGNSHAICKKSENYIVEAYDNNGGVIVSQSLNPEAFVFLWKTQPQPKSNRPSITAPVIPDVSAPISVENVSQLTRLTSLGEGDILNMQLSPDEKWIVLGTSNGILILDSTSMEKVIFLPTAMKALNISFLDDGAKVVAWDCFQGYLWTIPEGKLSSHILFMGSGELGQIYSNYYCTIDPDSNWEFAFGASTSPADWWSDSFLQGFKPINGLYRLNDNEIIYSLDFPIKQYAISPDGELVAVSSSDKLSIIQYQDGKTLREIPQVGINQLFFFPDGKIIGAVLANKLIFWNTDDLTLIKTINTYGIQSTSFSPDNTILALKTDSEIRFLNVENLNLISAINGKDFAFSADSQSIVVYTGNNQVQYFDLQPDRSLYTLTFSFYGNGLQYSISMRSTGAEYFSDVGSILSSDNSIVIVAKMTSGYSDRMLLAFDLDDGSLLQSFPTDAFSNHYGIDDALWIPNLSTFIVLGGGEAKSLGVLDFKTGEIKPIISNNTDMHYSAINFSPKSDLLVSVKGNRLLSWDIENNSYWQIKDYSNELTSKIVLPKIGFSPDESFISVLDASNETHFYNSADYSTIESQKEVESINWSYGTANTSPNGKYSASIQNQSNTQKVVVRNTSDENYIYELGEGWRVDFAFSSDSKMIAVSTNGPYGNQITIFGLSDGKSLFSTGLYFCNDYIPPMLSFSPDGKYLAVLPSYGYPQIWGIP